MPGKFVFKSSQTIGAAAAEQDTHYLEECFVDTGDLEVIRNVEDPRRILIGRTGSGKSALLARLSEVEENVIPIRPESLSLSYIANSNVLGFFSQAGVRLDIFYRLLWRHVFCVEILKARFHIDSEDRKKVFLDHLWRLIPKNKKHEQALDYLRNWGESFWEETEYRIREITTKLEKDLEGALDASIPKLGALSASAAKRLTEEQVQEVTQRAQSVVNRVQIRELSDVIDLLGEVLVTDEKTRFFLVIDRLDEDWVEDSLRFRLIRSLIQTSLDFAKINSLKIIVAIRSDLLDRVYRFARDTGFQEEKYRTSSLDISWTKHQLINVLDKRIDLLVRQQYTKQTVTHKDLLPTRKKRKQPAIDWMIERTLMRPRDIIHFFNVCIRHADGKPVISQQALRQAEGVYSRERLRALADEWYGLYPNLLHVASVLRKRKPSFRIDELPYRDLEENILTLMVPGTAEPGLDLDLMTSVWEDWCDMDTYRRGLFLIFYKVGLVGLKTEPHAPVSWSHLGGVSVSRAELSDNTKAFIHPTFWRVLGTTEREVITS